VQDQTLKYAQEVAQLRGLGRTLRRRIEEREHGLQSVLVADDESLMRALICATLSPESYELYEAATGAEAVRLLEKHRPTLVILDQRMPPPDGLEICCSIRVNPALKGMLIIMVTAYPEDEAPALAAGADAYLNKPFSPVELLATIDGLLTR
jgi:two-component system, OmpR family, phosphate regulon response regulator PhoB